MSCRNTPRGARSRIVVIDMHGRPGPTALDAWLRNPETDSSTLPRSSSPTSSGSSLADAGLLGAAPTTTGPATGRRRTMSRSPALSTGREARVSRRPHGPRCVLNGDRASVKRSKRSRSGSTATVTSQPSQGGTPRLGTKINDALGWSSARSKLAGVRLPNGQSTPVAEHA